MLTKFEENWSKERALFKKIIKKTKPSQVLLVTGGYDGSKRLSSTEVIVWGNKQLHW